MKVYILIGCVGAGKSTCAEKLSVDEQAEVISADEIYKSLPIKKISTKPYDHNIRNKILQTMYKQMEECLNKDQSCVIDYTNMPTRRRHRFLTIAKRHDAEIVCKLLLVDKDKCLNQIIKREQSNVGSHKILEKEKTIDLYMKRIKKSYPSLKEGFNRIESYQNGELKSVSSRHNKKRYLNCNKQF